MHGTMNIKYPVKYTVVAVNAVKPYRGLEV
jgi:hypothetical protein